MVGTGRKESAQIELKDLSGREIKGIAEKAAKKEMLTELKRSRVSPPASQETVILLMSRLGIPGEKTAARLKVNRKTAKKYFEHPRFIQSIKKIFYPLYSGVRFLRKASTPSLASSVTQRAVKSSFEYANALPYSISDMP